MLSKKLRAILKTALLTGLLFIAFVLLLNSLIEKPSVQRFLLSQLSKSIGYKLTVARGKVDLAKEWLDIDMGTQPLGTIDFLVSNIPVLGYILTGEEKSILVYAFKVTGALSNPKVQYVPIKNLGGSIVGVFKRLFFTPRRLLKKMSGLTEILTSKEGPLPEDDIETPYPLEF